MTPLTLPTLGPLAWVPAVTRPDLLAPPTARALDRWAEADPRVADCVAVAEIDPALADTETLNRAYELPPEVSANCVLVAGRRDGAERVAAVVVPATTRADVNYRVKALLDVRKASFLAMERATTESGMEHGGITPVGLPESWRLLVDAAAVQPGRLALMGSGVRRSKLLLPGELLTMLPGVEVHDVAMAR